MIYLRSLPNFTVTMCSSFEAGKDAATRETTVPFSIGWLVCGKGQGSREKTETFFGKVCASGEDLTGIEDDVSQHRTFTT